MNKYVGYFLIFICMLLLIVLCVHLGIRISDDIKNNIECDYYESQIKIN